MQRETCKQLAWDSEFFGVGIAQYSGDGLTAESADAALEFCRQRDVRCLYLLLPDDPAVRAAAESQGFDYVDTRVTLVNQAVTRLGEVPDSIRIAEPDDLPALRSIARASHHDTRFYFDPHFDRRRCDALYETWITRSCEGWVDRTFVALHEGRPSGYITCKLSDTGVGSIGLFAVAETARGKGHGTTLIKAALAYFEDSGMHSVQVVTQLRNTQAQRAYERSGFVTQSRRLWFHAWLPVRKAMKYSYRIPFNQPSASGNEHAYMTDALARGHISGDGIYTRKCQTLLETELGVHRALLTTSCTHSLEMCALLLDIRPGDEVIVPSFTFVSSVNAFVLRGARPVFADIRPDTLNLDERTLEALITPRTRAVVVVHYAGVGCEMDSILAIAGRHGIAVVEDNAHGLFGSYKGRHLGTFGSLATQSFHETKNIYCGEGGALLINDPAMAARAEILREKGTNRSAFFRGEVDKYTWVDIGSSFVLSDTLAAFLYAQLEQRERIQASRKRACNYYSDQLSGWAEHNGIGLPYVPPWCDQAYHMFYLRMPSLEARQGLIEHLKSRGIHSVFHYVPLHTSPMGLELGGRPGQCPVTERVSDTLVRLPLFNQLTEAEQVQVVSAIEQFRVPAETGRLAQTDRYIRAEIVNDPVTVDLVSLARAHEDLVESPIPSPVHK